MDELSLLANLDEKSLRAMADYYRALARRCAVRASELAAIREMRDRTESRLASLDDIAGLIENRIAAGMTPDQAMAAIGRETGIPSETIAHHFARHCREKREAERRNRDRKIMTLAARGWTNAMIAHHIGLHPSSVSRIVQRRLDEAPPVATDADELGRLVSAMARR